MQHLSIKISGVLLLSILPVLVSIAQPYHYNIRALTRQDGLVGNVVKDILQSSEGLFWILTDRGLNQYDGKKIVHLPIEKSEMAFPAYLMEDEQGLLWLIGGRYNWRGRLWRLYETHLLLFDPWRLEKITFTDRFGGKAPFLEREVTGVWEDKESKALCFSLENGKVYRYEQGAFTLVLDNGGAFSYTLVSAEKDHFFWLFSENELLGVNRAFEIQDSVSLPPGSLLNSFFRLDENRLIFGAKTPSGYTRMLKIGRKKPVQFLTFNNGNKLNISNYNYFFTAPDSSLWGVNNSGLRAFSKTGELAFDSSTEEELRNLEFRTDFNFNLTFDNNGIAWIGKRDRAIMLEVFKSPFTTYMSGQNISTRAITPLSDGHLLVFTYQGPMLLDPTTGHFRPAWKENDLFGIGSTTDASGKIWVATHLQDKAILCIDPATLSFTSLNLEIPEERPIDIYQPFTSRDGTVWLGTSRGLGRLDKANGQFTICQELNRASGLEEAIVMAFYENEEGLWILASEGLFLLPTGASRAEKMLDCGGSQLQYLYAENINKFWIGTTERGLLRWDRTTGATRYFSTLDGFPDNTIHVVYPDSRGKLWLPTNAGLIRFDPAIEQFEVFTESSGLAASEFNYASHYQAPDGTLYLGGINGIIAFNPDRISPVNKKAPPLRISKFEQWGRKSGVFEDKTRALINGAPIVLSRHTGPAVLDVFLEDFLAAEKNEYVYMVEGFDPGWQPSPDGVIRIGSLPYGKYTLKVKARGSKGHWSPKELSIPLISVRPFYFRWWFFATLVLLTGALVTLHFKLRFWMLKIQRAQLQEEVARRTALIEASKQTIEEQKTELEQLNRTKDRLFAIIGHELRNPLAYLGGLAERIDYYLNKGEYHRLSQLGKDLSLAARRLSSLMNNLLRWSLLQSNTLPVRRRSFEIESLLAELVEINRPLARLKKADIEWKVETTISLEADKEGIQVVLQNLISNAIKFSQPGGKIFLSAFRQNGEVAIQVKDYGIGMTKEQLRTLFQAPLHESHPGTAGEKGAGLGLSIAYEITRLHHGQLKVESWEGEGAVFTLLLPASQ